MNSFLCDGRVEQPWVLVQECAIYWKSLDVCVSEASIRYLTRGPQH